MKVNLQNQARPEDIEARSFAIIEEELGPNLPFTGEAWEVARRVVHTSADYALLKDLYLPDKAVKNGVSALLSGCKIFTDTEMARVGMPQYRLTPLGVQAQCIISLEGVAERAKKLEQTKAKSGLELASPELGGAIVAIGNAPTALLALIDYLDAGGLPPALVIGMPVGFVNAAESKEILLERAERGDLQAILLRGRRGGSPLVAAVVNALAVIALRRR